MGPNGTPQQKKGGREALHVYFTCWENIENLFYKRHLLTTTISFDKWEVKRRE